MQSIKSIYVLLFLCLIGIIEAKKQKDSNNKYYIIAIKDSSKYSFDIQPTKQEESKLHRKDLNEEEPKFSPINMNEVEQIISSDDCYSELSDKNLNATILCKTDNLLDNGKLDVKELEKTLKPKSSFVSKQLEELAELIIDNIDTYDSDEIVNDDVQNMIRKRKRSNSSEDIFKNEAFKKILKQTYTVLDVTVIYAYLSNNLYEIFKDLPNVAEIMEDYRIPFIDVPENMAFKTKDGKQITRIPKEEKASKNSKRSKAENYYNITDIKKDTNWEKVSIEKEAGHHLSLISQSKINLDLIGKYDTNFYYPATAGEGVDIFFIDSGINVNHADFDTTYRNVTCDAVALEGEYKKIKSTSKLYKDCALDTTLQYHGIAVASAAAGTINGVAKKANIHMISIEGYVSDYIAALEYIKDYAPNPHKTVINISSGSFYYSNVLDKLFNLMIRKGYMVFAAAGNEATDACVTTPRNTFVYGMVNEKNYPSSYVDVISVGGISNSFEDSTIKDDEDLYFSASFSNIGECVDIFAPGYAYLASFPENIEEGKIYDNVDFTYGTSFSSPIVAGAAALIIAENPKIKYDQDLMKQTLIDLSVKGIVKDLDMYHTPNRFLNIGKLVVYSSDNQYHGCGLLSGKMSCSGDDCCSKDGYCGKEEDYCEVECQPRYGICSTNNHPEIPTESGSIDDDDDEDEKFRDTWVYNYYMDLCLKFAPDNFLEENMILTFCDNEDEDFTWHIAKTGETQIIQNYYEDVCMNFDENGIAFAESCRTGTYINDITKVTKSKDLIKSSEFPGKCLQPILSDYDPYGITIFTENRGLRVMMDECYVEDEYQHWRLREVPGILNNEDEDDWHYGDDDDDQLGPIEDDDDEFGPIEDDDKDNEGDDNDNEEEEPNKEEEEEEEEKVKLNKRGLSKKITVNKQKVVVKRIRKCKAKMKMVDNSKVDDEDKDIKSDEEESLIGEAEGISSEEESLIGDAETSDSEDEITSKIEQQNEEITSVIDIENNHSVHDINEEISTDIEEEITSAINIDDNKSAHDLNDEIITNTETEIEIETETGNENDDVVIVTETETETEVVYETETVNRNDDIVVETETVSDDYNNEVPTTSIENFTTVSIDEEDFTYGPGDYTELESYSFIEPDYTPSPEDEIYNEYDELFNPDDYIECRTYKAVITNTKKVWIYNVEKNLCLTSSGRYRDSLRLQKCETDNKNQKWLVSDKEESYFVNQEDDDICIIYTPSEQLIINECIEDILYQEKHYVKNHAAIINIRDDGKLSTHSKVDDNEVCFNITNGKNKKSNDIIVNAVPCEEANATWKLTTEFPN